MIASFGQREFLFSSKRPGTATRFTLFYEDGKLTTIGVNDLRFTVEEWEAMQAAFVAHRDKP